MESIHVAKLPLTGLPDEASKNHILPEMNIAPLVSLGGMCDYVRTIILDQQCIEVQNNWENIVFS